MINSICRPNERGESRRESRSQQKTKDKTKRRGARAGGIPWTFNDDGSRWERKSRRTFSGSDASRKNPSEEWEMKKKGGRGVLARR